MSALPGIALRSAWNRRFVLSLTLLSIALSTFLLLGIERLRSDVRQNFRQAVSGTDLIVGARSSPVQLMLYSVFRIGNATHNMRWDSAEALARHPAVAWTAPLALGDSYQGFPVLGTTASYYAHFQHGDHQPLRLAQGRLNNSLFEAVLGAEVARQRGLRVGDRLTLSHGSGGLLGAEHADKPFTVSGILQPTGTPVDRTVHISLEAIEAIHLDWQGGAPLPGLVIPADQVQKFSLTPRTVTAVLVGLKTRAAVFRVQRWAADFEAEPLQAVLPGVALDQLWEVLGGVEQALLLMSALVASVSLVGLVAVVLAGLNERRRELAILRAVGAGPRHVFALLALEGLLLTLGGVLLGAAALWAAIAVGGPVLQAHTGIALNFGAPSASQWQLAAALLAVGALASLVPGWRAYRLSLADGLIAKV
jgi:putative ABC transport system permease protein